MPWAKQTWCFMQNMEKSGITVPLYPLKPQKVVKRFLGQNLLHLPLLTQCFALQGLAKSELCFQEPCHYSQQYESKGIWHGRSLSGRSPDHLMGPEITTWSIS